MNRYFCNIVKNLSIPKYLSIEDQTSHLSADSEKVSNEKYKDHSSIICIKNKISSMNNPTFSHNFVSFEQTLDEINKLNTKKHLRIRT